MVEGVAAGTFIISLCYGGGAIDSDAVEWGG